MNDELFEYYSNLLIGCRSEARYNPLLGILNTMLELGYGERHLTQIYNMEIDAASEHIEAIENLILSSAITEFARMGVTINPDFAYARPSSLNYLLSAVMSDIENHEDPERLYGFLSKDEAGVFELQHMLSVIYCDYDIQLTELIIRMSPRFLIFIRNALENKIAENEIVDDDDNGLSKRIALFIQRFPQNPETVTFYNFDESNDVEALYDVLPYDLEDYENHELCVIYVTGICVLKSTTYDEAYGMAYEILERVAPGDELNELKVLSDVNQALFDIYDALNVGGQDE